MVVDAAVAAASVAATGVTNCQEDAAAMTAAAATSILGMSVSLEDPNAEVLLLLESGALLEKLRRCCFVGWLNPRLGLAFNEWWWCCRIEDALGKDGMFNDAFESGRVRAVLV